MRAGRVDVPELWSRRYRDTVRVLDGRMVVELGRELCVLELPEGIAGAVLRIAKTDQYCIPLFRGERWLMFGESRTLTGYHRVLDLGRHGIQIRAERRHYSLGLVTPGAGASWLRDLEWGKPVPPVGHLLELILATAGGV